MKGNILPFCFDDISNIGRVFAFNTELQIFLQSDQPEQHLVMFE